MKAASTTKVAPCSACAGPNTAPRNEWAIMMWSRTSTVNKAAPSCVGDELAEYSASLAEDIRQSPGEIGKSHGRRKQRIEPRIGEQRDRSGEAAAVRPAWPVRRRDLADLARYQPKPAAVEGASEHRRHGRISIPAHFKHGCLFACELDSRAQPVRRAAGMNDEVAVAFGLRGLRKTNPKRSANSARAGLMSTSVTSRAGKWPAEIGDQRAHHAGADDGDAVGRARCGVPHRVERRLHVGGEHRALRGQGLRYLHGRAGRDVEQALMRMQREECLPRSAPLSTWPTVA